MATSEIIVVGNEVLLGLIQDTNSGYLSRVVRARQGRLRHIAVVADEIGSIADELILSIGRLSELIFTCGGLGPTEDDLTLAAVAQACDRQLVLNHPARDFVIRRYAELAAQGYVASAAMTEARLKMAWIPDGATIIENPVGTAPATVLRFRGSVIVSLPGVPAELKGIVEGPLQGVLEEVFGRGAYVERELLVDCGDESVLAPLLREVSVMNAGVYIKSHAGSFGAEVRLRVTLAATGLISEEAEAKVRHAAHDLTTLLKTAGIQVVLN